MSVPGFQQFFISVLIFLNDTAERSATRQRVISGVADLHGLDEESRAERLPNSPQAVYNNRIGWAMTYLKKAFIRLEHAPLHVLSTLS